MTVTSVKVTTIDKTFPLAKEVRTGHLVGQKTLCKPLLLHARLAAGIESSLANRANLGTDCDSNT